MQKKYEFTDEQHPYSPGLRRIRALVDIPRAGVRAGDLGGWLEKEENLHHDGAAWVSEDAQVYGNARVSGNAWVFGKTEIFDNTEVYGDAQVYGTAGVFGNAMIYGNARVSGNARVHGDALVSDAAQVYGDARVSGNARIYGDALVHGDALVFGVARVQDTAQVLHTFVQASSIFPATLFKTPNEVGHHLIVGCWEGSIRKFRAMIESDRWVNATPAEIEKHRPELLAFTAMCEARMKTWGDE